MESPKSNQNPPSSVAATQVIRIESGSSVNVKIYVIPSMRIEKKSQSIKHIDTVNRAIMACRLQFWDASNNPIEKAQVSVFENGDKKDGNLIYETDTNVDGEADIEFVMDVIQEIRKKLYFSLLTKHSLGRSHVFLLTDDKNPAMHRQIDEILLRKSFQDDSEALLNNFNDRDAVRNFTVKYQGRVTETLIKEVMEEIKRRKKEQQLCEERLKVVNSKIEERLLVEADHYSHGPGALWVGELGKYYKYEDYTPWINNVTVFDDEENKGQMLIDRQGKRRSATFAEIKHHAGNVWLVRYQDKRYYMNNNGWLCCDANGTVGSTKSRDKYGFMLPDLI